MDDREWQAADDNRGVAAGTENVGTGEAGTEKTDGFFKNEDGWWKEEDAGQAAEPIRNGNGGQYQNGGQNQSTGQNENNGQYQEAGQYQNGGQYQNNGQYQNGNPGYFPNSPYQGAPLQPDGWVDGPEEPIKVSEWLLTMLVLAIPCVNLIMLFVWGFGGSEKRSKANFCKAQLIWMAISAVIVFLFYIVIIAGVMAGMS